jgi:hypothetical protein
LTEEAIESSLLEVDGSCRDINFSENISTAGAAALLESIGARWKLTCATDAEGESVQKSGLVAFLTNEKGALSTVWKGPISPRHLQAYFYWAEPDHVFCELTFFPEDLDTEQFTLGGFLELLAVFVSAARSPEYYVRFEDASWCHADGGTKQSVIFSHENVSLLAPSS